MKFFEVEPEKKIVISKVEFVCDLIDDSIPKPLFQNYNIFSNFNSTTALRQKHMDHELSM